jgi:hypothetical protein
MLPEFITVEKPSEMPIKVESKDPRHVDKFCSGFSEIFKSINKLTNLDIPASYIILAIGAFNDLSNALLTVIGPDEKSFVAFFGAHIVPFPAGI